MRARKGQMNKQEAKEKVKNQVMDVGISTNPNREVDY